MRQRTPLRVDTMEGRCLLSPLSYSLTTDKSVYQAGETIQFTFTQTNTGSQPVNVMVVPADFKVIAGAAVIWQSNPDSSSETLISETLNPGQSVTQTATWSATESFLGTEINQWGSFAVSNANAPGVSAPFQIADPLVTSLTPDKTAYQVGQPVEITSYVTNTSSHPVTIVTTQGASDDFYVSQNGATIWTGGVAGTVVDPISPSSVELGTATIQPGQSATYTVTWDGVPSSVESTANIATGTFMASIAGSPQGPTSSFQIESPSKRLPGEYSAHRLRLPIDQVALGELAQSRFT